MRNSESRFNETSSQIEKVSIRIKIVDKIMFILALLSFSWMVAVGYILVSEVLQHGLKEVIMNIWEG